MNNMNRVSPFSIIFLNIYKYIFSFAVAVLCLITFFLFVSMSDVIGSGGDEIQVVLLYFADTYTYCIFFMFICHGRLRLILFHIYVEYHGKI